MKLRNRLILFFTLAAAIILLIISLLIYFSLSRQASAPLLDEQLDKIRILLAGGYFLGLLLFYLAARFSAVYILRPLNQTLQKARDISTTNLHQRLEVEQQESEEGQLVLTINDLLDRLQHSFELQRNFISNASHEIRNPLTAIMGEAEVCLQKRRSPEAYMESMASIAREADRLEALVSSLLSLTKTELGETNVEREEVRLDEVLQEAKIDIDKTNPHNQIRLDFSELPSNSDWLTLQGNQNLLRIALTNLMENATKFSKNKEVLVKLSATDKAIQLSISDLGIGIPEQEIEKIFQPFYRAKNARSFKGFGIGLSLTDKIIRMHQGNMHIHSKEGQGTTIEMHFNKI